MCGLRAVALLAALLVPSFALAQATVLQAGPWQPGHVPAYSNSGSSTPTVVDGGPAGGGGVGTGVSELDVTAQGTGSPPYQGQGTGPYGTIGCFYDGPITSANGYHYFCLSPYAQGGGLIAYGAAGVAAQLPLYFNINGVAYEFPFSTTGVVGPSTTVAGHLATWNNTVGTLLADGGPAPVYSICSTNQFATGFSSGGVLQCAQPAFSNLSGIAQPSQGGLGAASLTGYLYGNGGSAATASSTIPTTVLAGTLATAQVPALTGDVTTPGASLVTTLATVNSNVGTYGSPSAIPVVTVNGKGLVTAVTTVPPTTGAALCGASGLKIVNTSGTPTTSTTVTAVNAILVNSSGNAISDGAANFPLVLSTATSGNGGLDTGSLAGSTWYFVWLDSNGALFSGVYSASSTAPTFPSGYNYSCRVGAVLTNANGSPQLMQTLQFGAVAQYVVAGSSTVTALPIMAQGFVGSLSTGPRVAVAVGTFVPPTATHLLASLNVVNGGFAAIVAPNASYGPQASASNPPPVSFSTSAGNTNATMPFDFLLESSNIYWASNGSNNSIVARGWVDSVNAN